MTRREPSLRAEYGRRDIVDHAAFERACVLLLIDIPAHVNECFECRKGQAAVNAALDGKAPNEVDHEAFRVAAEMFCPIGQAQTTEYGEMTLRAFGLPSLVSGDEAGRA